MQYLLAHDLGTSADKAVLYDITGEVVAEATADYPTYYHSSAPPSKTRRTGGGLFA